MTFNGYSASYFSVAREEEQLKLPVVLPHGLNDHNSLCCSVHNKPNKPGITDSNFNLNNPFGKFG